MDPAVTDIEKPPYNRRSREVGVFLIVYDAVPQKEENYGLKHFFLITVAETLYQYLTHLDLVDLKGNLLHNDAFHDIILERFLPGVILCVSPLNKTALFNLWELYVHNDLENILQNVIVTEDLLQKLGLISLTLHVKLFDKERTQCNGELDGPPETVLDFSLTNDLAALKKVAAFQKKMKVEIMSLRQKHMTFNQTIADFLSVLRKLFPSPIIGQMGVQTLGEVYNKFEDVKTHSLDGCDKMGEYMMVLETLRCYCRLIFSRITDPLTQIHPWAEDESQRENRAKIVKCCTELSKMLRPEMRLSSFRHPDYDPRFVPADEVPFLPVLGIVPSVLDKMRQAEYLIDDYLMDYPEVYKALAKDEEKQKVEQEKVEMSTIIPTEDADQVKRAKKKSAKKDKPANKGASPSN